MTLIACIREARPRSAATSGPADARASRRDNGAPYEAAWLHVGPLSVRMPAPHAGDDASPETALQRRVDYLRALLDGATVVWRHADIPDGTCLVCGELPLLGDGGFRCELCERASRIALEQHLAARP